MSFADKETERFWLTGRSRRFQGVAKQAYRKLQMLHAAAKLDDLRIPPANRLEALSGNRKGQYSIRINRQWRICFNWQDGAENVEIVDYH